MKRLALAGLLGMAAAACGCAETRSLQPMAGRPAPPPPVGLESLPEIHRSINGDPRVADRRARPQPEPGGTAPAEAQMSQVAPRPAPFADRTPGSPRPRMPSPEGGPATDESARASADADRIPIEPTSSSMPAPTGADPSLGAQPDAMPPLDLAPMPSGPEAAPAPAEPLPGPEPMPGPTPAPPLGADPSLGAQPDAMPPLDLAPMPAPPPEDRATYPASDSTPEAAPPAELPPLPGSSPTAPPLAGSEPAAVTAPEAMPPLGPAPGVGEIPATGSAPEAIHPVPLPPLPQEAEAPAQPAEAPPVVPAPDPPSTADPAVRAASAEPASVRSEIEARPLGKANAIAARVGDGVITMQELTDAVQEHLKGAPQGMKPSREELNMVAAMTLDSLIDRAVILQEARRAFKNPKQWDKFVEHVDKAWTEEELPPLFRQHNATNRYELKLKLAEQKKSLDAMQEEFRNGRMAREFMLMKLSPLLSVDLPEMRDYYNEHLKDFERPAQITWREILVEVGKHPDRAAARREAESLLARLRTGADFVKLARTESDGPSRSEGGLWKTSPGGYNVPAVNEALDSLPLNQISTLIEGPTSYHIVRVEARRVAGPAQFPEVQDEIYGALREAKYQREVKSYIAKLREGTMISSPRFDGTQSAPRETRPAGPSAAFEQQ